MKTLKLIMAAIFVMCFCSAYCGAQEIPAVTNVVVISTAPDNGTVPYNTGEVTVQIVGSGFSAVTGTNGVRLDDLNGNDDPVRTAATNYTVDSDTQITATFPIGIRTHGAGGWNVIVTNSVGANTNSVEKYVPRAGLLISEIFIGTTANNDHEFVEVYNPTASKLNASTLDLRFHVRNSSGGDSAKGLTKVTDGDIPAHGFLLLVSSNAMSESWATNRDYLWTAGAPTLAGNCGVYINLGPGQNVKVLDKVGWGSQPIPGFEGLRLPTLTNDFSAERKPAGGWGHATDTDTNLNDFLTQSTNITPRGSADPLEPPDLPAPTVTNVIVLSTAPDNGTVPYNTGLVTIRIVGSGFATVPGTNGVMLDDLDGTEVAVRTATTNYTVDSDTQITATFPPGIRTRGAEGWNVIVTNSFGANTNSVEKFVPRAGLLISEVYPGKTGATDREFVEVYNPTVNSLSAPTLGFRLHIRSATGSDTAKSITAVTAGNIPAHGFLLLVSTAATNESWSTNRDYTYSGASSALVGNGGVYISLSSTAGAKVIDKAGWGTQPANGYEGTALANINSDYSVERKPAGGWGHATDTDTNLNDFLSASTIISPCGSADPLQPPVPTSIIIVPEALLYSEGHFSMAGITSSNLTLSIRCSPDLSSNFSIIGTATADGNGAFDYDDADAAPADQRFYRVTYP